MHVDTSIYTTLPRYDIASVDNSTLYTKVNFVKEKKETAEVVVRLIKEAERETGWKMKVLDCDKAKELEMGEVKKYCESNGIKIYTFV